MHSRHPFLPGCCQCGFLSVPLPEVLLNPCLNGTGAGECKASALLFYIKKQLVKLLFKLLQPGIKLFVFSQFLYVQFCEMYCHHA